MQISNWLPALKREVAMGSMVGGAGIMALALINTLVAKEVASGLITPTRALVGGAIATVSGLIALRVLKE